jgi:hypothetical protein
VESNSDTTEEEMKKWLFETFVAGKVAKMFSGLKGYKTQVGLVAVIGLTAAKYFAPIPVEYLPYIDRLMDIIVGATGVSLGDKIRRNYEIGKVMAEEAMNRLPTSPEQQG